MSIVCGMVADLRADGARFLAYANPFVDPKLGDARLVAPVVEEGPGRVVELPPGA